MKIAYILNSFPNISTTFIVDEIIAMQERGLVVEVFAFIQTKDKITHESIKRIKTVFYFKSRQLAKIFYYHLYWLMNRPGRYFKCLWLALRPKNQFLKLFIVGMPYVYMVYARKPDLLHAHFGTRPADFCMLVKMLTGVPYTFTTHRYDIFITPPLNYALKSRMAVKHITISEYNKRYLIEKFGIYEDAIQVIHCGIDFSRVLSTNHGEKQNLILSVSRLEEHKNIELLIKACAELEKRSLDFQCLIVGDGPRNDTLQKLIHQLHLER
jgi:colanic acid/amylovoran biosynthesis glycosyltransferase